MANVISYRWWYCCRNKALSKSDYQHRPDRTLPNPGKNPFPHKWSCFQCSTYLHAPFPILHLLSPNIICTTLKKEGWKIVSIMGNSGEWCTKNCPPQDCPPYAILRIAHHMQSLGLPTICNPEVGEHNNHLFAKSIFLQIHDNLQHAA